MHRTHRAANPFAMMLDPQAVLARVAHSERLSRLESRICRPLDKPLLGRLGSDMDALDGEDFETDDLVDAGDAMDVGGARTVLGTGSKGPVGNA